MGRRISREEREKEFIRKMRELTREEYTLLSDYYYNNQAVTMRHEICGREFDIRPRSFTSTGSRCHHCSREQTARKNSKNHLQSHSEYQSKLESKQGVGTFNLLSEYKGSVKKIKIRHNCELCNNYEGWVIAGQLLQKGCPSMKHKKKKYDNGWVIYCELSPESQKIDSTHEAFIEKVNSLEHSDSIRILGKYTKAKHKIEIQCVRCGVIRKVLPQQVVRNSFCQTCGFKKRNKTKTISLEEMLGRLDEWYEKEEYSVVNPDTYVDSTIHTLFRHNTCGYEWDTTMTNVVRGHGCPKCNIFSKAEIWISEILSEHNIKFKGQYTFSDLKNEKLLRFDFAIFNKEDDLEIILEYNGRQHYNAVEFFNNSTLIERRERDRKKMLYLKEHKIPLGIIPYSYNSKKKIEKLLYINNII